MVVVVVAAEATVVAASTEVVVAAAWEVLVVAEEVALVLVLFVMGHSDSVEDLDFEVVSSDFVKGNLDFAAEKGDLAVNVDPVVEFDFVMGVLPVEFQVLELVVPVAVEALEFAEEDPDPVMEVPGSALVGLDSE